MDAVVHSFSLPSSLLMVEDTFGTIGRPRGEDIEYARGLERNLSDHDSEDSSTNIWTKNHEAVFIALFEQQRITVTSMLHILFGDSVMTNMLDFPVIPAQAVFLDHMEHNVLHWNTNLKS